MATMRAAIVSPGLAITLPGVVSASPALAKGGAEVACYGAAAGGIVYKVKPSSCAFTSFNEPPSGARTMYMVSLHGKHWGSKVVTGTGDQSSHGTNYPLVLRLSGRGAGVAC
jgi:hypothetical protein